MTYSSEWVIHEFERGCVCIGGICLDEYHLLTAPHQRGKNRIRERHRFVGGGAGNVVQGLRRLARDRPILLFAPRGADANGDVIDRHMTALEIAMPWRPIADGTTSYSHIFTHGGEGTIFASAGVRKAPLPVELIDRELKRAEACLLISPGCNSHVEIVTRLAARHHVPVYFGPNGEQVALGVAGLRNVLAGPIESCICNRGEAMTLTGCEDIEAMLAAIRSLGARRAVITDGAQGMHGLDEQGYVFVSAYSDERPFLDDVGCGDAALAAIVHFLVEGCSLEESMRAGARQGFEVGTAIGTTTALAGIEVLREYAQLVCV